MEEAQLCIENAAKAIISCFQIPSGSHDPSDELREAIAENKSTILEFADSSLIQRLETLEVATHVIAPEHGRASYGDIRARIPPWHLYSEKDGKDALEQAEESFATSKEFIEGWYRRAQL